MTNIYSYLTDWNLMFLQNLAGSVLDHIQWRTWYTDLADCQNSVILARDIDINAHFDLSKTLLDQNNFFIIVNLGESLENMTGRSDASRDLPELDNFPTIGGSTVRNGLNFGVDSYLFKILDMNNIMRSEWIMSGYSNQRQFDFLFLNGRHRTHRSRLWKKLENQGLLSNSLCSYLGFHPSKPCDIPPVLLPDEYESKYAKTKHYSVEFVRSHRNTMTFKQDVWQSQWIDGYLDPVNRFTDTYFSLVTETEVDLDGRQLFITEKTFKPLLAGHPFVILAQPGVYQYLRSLGFETFNGIVDENFDQEIDTEKRTDMIVSEVARLCNSDLSVFADQCQEICQHNHSKYHTLAQRHFSHIHQEFEKWIIDILDRAKVYIAS